MLLLFSIILLSLYHCNEGDGTPVALHVMVIALLAKVDTGLPMFVVTVSRRSTLRFCSAVWIIGTLGAVEMKDRMS